jgi:hypothetical protein
LKAAAAQRNSTAGVAMLRMRVGTLHAGVTNEILDGAQIEQHGEPPPPAPAAHRAIP